MMTMMEEVIRREKAETWERVAQIEKKVDHDESKIKSMTRISSTWRVRWPSSKVVRRCPSLIREGKTRIPQREPVARQSGWSSTWLSGSANTRRDTRGTRRPEIEAFRNALVDKMDACYQPHIFEPTVLARDNYRRP